MHVGCEVSSSDIAAIAAHAAFGRPLITNVHRGLIAEAIVSKALGEEWSWRSADYAGWDFERADGVRLEVKQAASRQSWHGADDQPSRISFDVRERKGRYEGAAWVPGNQRWADVYVFAHHYVADASADHRNASQWAFYVVAARELPNQLTIALSRVRGLAAACSQAGLSEELNRVLACSPARSG